MLSVLIVRSGIWSSNRARHLAGALVFSRARAWCWRSGAFVVIWKDGINGMGHAFAAIGIGRSADRLIRLSRLSRHATADDQRHHHDALDPPRFDVLARLRPRGTVEYAGLYAAELQRKA